MNTAQTVGTAPNSLFFSNGALPTSEQTETITSKIANRKCMKQRLVNFGSASLGLSAISCTTWTPTKWSKRQTPHSFSSSVYAVIAYSLPVTGSGAAFPSLCCLMPSAIISSCSSVFNGYFVFKYQAKRAPTPEQPPNMTRTDITTEVGCNITLPLSAGMCPQEFIMARGSAAAGMAIIFGRKDLNIVYVASFRVPVRNSS
mmetsp:Transcript_12540/g.24465  ORF Transcript_12540/g.24465 Transcript_12540/m.24465 type:complete len:201 (-) Transcript_12540:2133-2735(-)